MWYRFLTAGRKEIEGKFGKQTYEIVKSIDSNLQPSAAIFVNHILNNPNNGSTIEQVIDTFKTASELVQKKYINVIAKGDEVHVIKNQNDVFKPDEFLPFTEKIDFYKSLLTPANTAQQKNTEDDLQIADGQITVKKANNVSDAIRYGQGTTWCISQPRNTMYQSYRTMYASTFYFVFDTTRPEGDPLRRVVVDARGGGVVLTDLDNNTGTISHFKNESEYLEYLKNNGVDVSQFKNEPLTEKERKEYNFISDRVYQLDSFISLHSRARKAGIEDIYSKYIGFGHMLSSDHLKYLKNIGAKNLIDQYVGTGNPIHKDDIEILSNQQKNSYFRARNIFYENLKNEQYTNYNGAFDPDSMTNNVHNDQFIDGLFFENLLKEGAYPTNIFRKLIEVNYQNDGKLNDMVEKMMNLEYNKTDLNRVTNLLCFTSRDDKLLDKFLDLHPEQINYLKNELETHSYNFSGSEMSFMNGYLFKKFKDPSLFVELAARLMINNDYEYDGLIQEMLEAGYADKIMDEMLGKNYPLQPQIDFLLANGASLEKAGELAISKYYVNIANGLHIMRLLRSKGIDPLAEKPPEAKEQDFQEPVMDDTKQTQSFNLKAFLKI